MLFLFTGERIGEFPGRSGPLAIVSVIRAQYLPPVRHADIFTCEDEFANLTVQYKNVDAVSCAVHKEGGGAVHHIACGDLVRALLENRLFNASLQIPYGKYGTDDAVHIKV